MKPFLIFGLRGTLVERLHVRNIPNGMPEPHLNVGLTRVWLRHDMLETLLALQSTCHLAIWSSTTARNTKALTDAVFHNEGVWKKMLPEKFGSSSSTSAAGTAAAATATAATNSETGSAAGEKGSGRFSRRKVVAEEPTVAPVNPTFVSPVKFEFIWTREHTIPDEFRRTNAIIRDDAHATIKDLSRVYAAFPGLATPANTILIDDTPSKAKLDAANFLWVDSCQDLGIADKVGMKRLLSFINTELTPGRDVRSILPQRIRSE